MTCTYPSAAGFGRVTTPLVDRNRPLFETCGRLDPFSKTLGLISPGLESFVIRLGFRADFVARLRLELGIGIGGVGVGDVSCIAISLLSGMCQKACAPISEPSPVFLGGYLRMVSEDTHLVRRRSIIYTFRND